MRKLSLIALSIVAAAIAAVSVYAACAAGTPTNADTGTTCTPQNGNTQCQYTKTSTWTIPYLANDSPGTFAVTGQGLRAYVAPCDAGGCALTTCAPDFYNHTYQDTSPSVALFSQGTRDAKLNDDSSCGVVR